MTPRAARLAVLILALALATIAACSSASTPPRVDRNSPSPSGGSPSTRGSDSSSSEPAGTIHSSLMPGGYVRLPVSSADITHQVRINRTTIAGFATGGAFSGEVDAVISKNNGASWLIDSPKFSVGDRLVMSTDRTLVAWGHGDPSVRTRRYGERHWHQTQFRSGLRSLSISGRRLIVATRHVAGSSTPKAYTSNNDGLTWRPGITS